MRKSWPAVARNRAPLLDVLRRVLTRPGTVLEIASGSGEHAVFFARALPYLRWQPTDIDPDNLASQAAWRDHEGLDNVLPPRRLDVHDPDWPAADAIFNANMIHIAPWSACEALFQGAGRTLAPGAPLVMYGPYKEHGRHTAESNAAFDASLRERDPEWGVRDLGDVLAVAERHGFTREEVVRMPANNLTVIYRRV